MAPDESEPVWRLPGAGTGDFVAAADRSVLAYETSSRVKVFDAAAGAEVALVPLAGKTALAVGPAGRVALGHYRGHVYVVDASGKKRRIASTGGRVVSLAFSADGARLAWGADDGRVGVLTVP
jgi:hypothetical protein